MINKNIIQRKGQGNMRLVKIAILIILGHVAAQAKVIKKNNKIVKSDIMTTKMPARVEPAIELSNRSVRPFTP